MLFSLEFTNPNFNNNPDDAGEGEGRAYCGAGGGLDRQAGHAAFSGYQGACGGGLGVGGVVIGRGIRGRRRGGTGGEWGEGMRFKRRREVE